MQTHPATVPKRGWWAEWPWAPYALAAWLLAIAGAAAACGAINSAPGHDIPGSTWAVEAALAGLGFGFLLGLLTPLAPWRGEARVIPLAGSALYSLVYVIATVVGYGSGTKGGEALVVIVIAVACSVPMVIAAVVGYTVRAALLSATRRSRPDR